MDEYMGMIKLFAGTFAPQGWAFCDGSLIQINSNQALFSLLGTQFGGDGRTTFGLPDLRGRVAIGAGNGPGLSPRPQAQKAGTEAVTLTTPQLPAHTHAAGAVTVAVTNPGSVDVPVNTNSDGEGVPSKDVTGILLGGAVNAFTNASTANGKYAGKSLPVQGTQVTASGGTIGSTGANQPVSIVQPFTAINYIICTNGLYPSRP
jgi:microcystin-dependent protein